MCMKSLRVTIQMKATEQYFRIVPCKVIPTFEKMHVYHPTIQLLLVVFTIKRWLIFVEFRLLSKVTANPYLHCLDHTNVAWFEGVQRLHGCLQGWHGFRQIALTLILDAFGYSSRFTGNCFVRCNHLLT